MMTDDAAVTEGGPASASSTDLSEASVCVLVPTLNESETIGSVIDGFVEQGLDNVLVVDGHSSDDTREVAEAHGARVVVQSGSGKGQAVREALGHVESDYVLMVDGDGTYRPEDALAMLEPLLAGEAEHVIGNRFADMDPNAMSGLNQVGNRLFNAAFRTIHGGEFDDILSGYRAFTRESLKRMGLTAEGFGIETEMAVECARHGITTKVVPISYLARPDGSETNLHPVKDGGVILLTIYRMAKTSNPLFYFGSVALFCFVVGAAIGTYVGVEWFTARVSHEVLAVVDAFTILLGVQLLMFGVLSDLIVTLHHEQMSRYDED